AGAAAANGVAGDIVADVGRAIGGTAELRGFLVSGGDNVVLRVGLENGELAVRVAITELGAARVEQQCGVLAAINSGLTRTDLQSHMPKEVAVGKTHGLPWRAESWQAGHLSTRGRRWRTRSPAWAATHRVARLLADTAPTGNAGEGWARTWAREMDQFGVHAARAIEEGLSPIEDARVPTSWCHGDLWPGNVVLTRRSTVLIDWEQGRPMAPLGMDGVFLELHRIILRDRLPFGVAAARAVRQAEVLIAPPDTVGVPWLSTPPPIRAAVIAAAAVVHALGPKGDRRGPAWAEENIVPLLSALADVRA
ncbi:MAG: aminoglycoside phosphotransferase family protein, partial [Candidatus Dormibacteraeota bacterium]|nr:aminoglycoside phosphotransferase family protein [Candidatus Dormibacteraeota bacterium]